MLRFEFFCMRLVEVLFFTGLIGCSVVVLASWISIFKSEFAKEERVFPMDFRSTPVTQTYRFNRPDL